MKEAYLEEDTDPGKHGTRSWEYLSHTESEDRPRAAKHLAITSPTASPRIAENAYKTLTVGSSHFVNFSSAP